ncbi:hypothetical protein GGC47_003189 [Bosea sp. OAE752]
MLALTLLLTLAGCVMTTGGNATKSALCDQFRPIRWDDADTDQTIVQAKQHNAVGKRLCGWTPGI